VAALVVLVPLCLFCSAATVADLRLGRIPNLLNLAGFTAGVSLCCARWGAAGLVSSLAGSALGLAILLVPFLLRMVGGGDVKFLAASGAFIGWRLLWPSFVAGAALGGLLALALFALREKSLKGAYRTVALLASGAWTRPGGHVREQRLKLPYAVPLSIGLLLVSLFHFLVRGA
jgi:prepilin peptidase CpaA